MAYAPKNIDGFGQIINPRLDRRPPRHLRNKTALEIVAYFSSAHGGHYKSEFIFDEAGRVIEDRPLNKSTDYMMRVAQAVLDDEHWKNPIVVRFSWTGSTDPFAIPMEWIKACWIWHWAATEEDGTIVQVSDTMLLGHGYQAW